MIEIRRAGERGHAEHGWLDSWHTFSFGDYHDPKHRGFRVLRVINEDRVAAGQGFEEHSHENMEIISYVLRGALEHRDSLGSGSVLRPGDVQRMSAGRGVTHSEFNHSKTEPVHFLQIWILPERAGLAPAYEEKRFPEEERRDRLRLVVSRDGAEGSLRMNQDARLYASLLGAGVELRHALPAGRHAWLQLARGCVRLNGERLEAGDGAAVSSEPSLVITGVADSELLFFELP